MVIDAPAWSVAVMVMTGLVVSEFTVNVEDAALLFPAASVNVPAPTEAVMAFPSLAAHSNVQCVSRVTAQLLPAEPSPAVRSVVSVMTAPLTDATTRSEPFGVAWHVLEPASASRIFMPAAMVAFAAARVIVLAAPASMVLTANVATLMALVPPQFAEVTSANKNMFVTGGSLSTNVKVTVVASLYALSAWFVL